MADTENTTGAPGADQGNVVPFVIKTYTLESMPFIKTEKGRGRNFWSVDPPDDYVDACHYGADMACALLRFQDDREDGFRLPMHQLIRWIVFDQVRRGDNSTADRGALVGFWGVLGSMIEALASPKAAEALEAFEARQREAHRRALEEERRHRSEQARRAALIGAEKRRMKRGQVVPITT